MSVDECVEAFNSLSGDDQARCLAKMVRRWGSENDPGHGEIAFEDERGNVTYYLLNPPARDRLVAYDAIS